MRTSDGIELRVVELGGAGPPIVVLHGLMGRAATWWPVARWLADHGRVVGIDARGHGRSQARGPWTTQRLAADVVELLTEIGPAVVVGHSMGGLHGLVAASSRPDLVRALVVEDMGVDFVGAAGRPAPGSARCRRGGPRSRRCGRRSARYGDYMIECVEERDDGWALLASVAHTTAIAAEWASGTGGTCCPACAARRCSIEATAGVVPAGQMAEMARRLPDARHVVAARAGHLVHRDAPEAYRAA